MSSSIVLAKFATLEEFHNVQGRLDKAYETPVLKIVADAETKGYGLTYIPLTTEAWKARWRSMCILSPSDTDREKNVAAELRAEAWRSSPSFLRDEVTVTRLEEVDSVVGLVSDWLELDANDDWIRHDSEIALQQELAYASYLNIQTVVLPPPRNRAHVASYARAVNASLNSIPYMQLSVRLPIYDPSIFKPPVISSWESNPDPFATSDSSTPQSSHIRITTDEVELAASDKSTNNTKISEGELNATWEMWDVIRSVCHYDQRLSLTLDLTPPLPSSAGVLKRWAAEPMHSIFLPASTFIANARGYPVLPKGTQTFIRDIAKYHPTVILGGANTGLHSRGGETAYLQYVRHLENTSPAIQAMLRPGTVENFAQGYTDYLQAPLQPLMDNLPSATYHTFEQDPVKYRNYEEAIYQALTDWPESDRIVICVAGAGRGPLVARSLKAIERSRRKAFVYALEKNPNAYVTLQDRLEREWGSRVDLRFGDMRVIELPEKVDILVSELLGSFGDNELSPECLDGAMRFLQPSGISIPSSYTAHIAPLSSSKLYQETQAGRDVKTSETPYVVMFQAVNVLSGSGGGLAGRCGPQVQECWEFEHPRRDAALDSRGLPLTNSHNTRSAKLTFHIPHAGVLHGLAGYFEAILYGNVGLSIHPDRKDQISKDMLSWFPIFFPFKEPLYLPSNSELQVTIWRLTSRQRVWYEWYAESFLPVWNAPLPQEKEKVREGPVVNRHGSWLAPAATPVAPPSPVVDAIDLPFPADRSMETPPRSSEDWAKTDIGLVKIGQTSLHNPGGRSSWIGL
ncbi:PRMT5-domain-containing protein [Neolentinus lepideus HHB14362 ss-1]|uniref:PRMT5-domain-containing protein n=1 Tax=Neolentinus lepideus HHB14362 ss-1 TaxID=1314782 RepID=A0A165QFJ8_9AGAM|nr:PRMT5-domain-containing protein [Neolentinus lepideus HHB14362 ss-1]